MAEFNYLRLVCEKAELSKILIVIGRLNLGGTAQYISELVHGLQSYGFEVLVITGNVQGHEIEDAAVASLPIVRIPTLGRKISLFDDLKARKFIGVVVSEFVPDLVYSHTFKAGLLVRSLNISVPRIHAFHGHLLADPEFTGWKRCLVVALERLLAPRAHFLVTVGKRVALELLDAGIGRTEQYRSIAPGVRPFELEDRWAARKALGISDELRPVVVWMARVTSVKAPHRVAMIARATPGARFLLAGGGDLLEELSRDLPSNLTLVGWQPAERMWAVADLAISTSENEGMPIALIEAQIAGIPVVGIDVGSVGEIVKNGKSGYLFAEFGEDYIKKVRDLVADRNDLKRLGDFAKEQSVQEFSPSALIKSHVEMFEEILCR